MQRSSDARAISEWRRAACWQGWFVALSCGCSFPAHEFTNDVSRVAGGASSAGAGSQQATGIGAGGAKENGGAGAIVTSPSGGAASETCDNRIDDDGDGRIDCSDPDCVAANWVCLPSIPEGGWRGPIAIATASTATGLPDCEETGRYHQVVSAAWCSKVSATHANCVSCPACGNVINPNRSVTLNLGIDCSGSCITTSSTDCRIQLEEGCQAIGLEQSALLSTASLAQLTIRVEPPTISGGTCQSAMTQGAPEMLLDAKCLEPMKICKGPAAGTCASGGSCILMPQAPYSSVPCIYFEGPQASCPEGWDSLRQIAYTNVVDTRACTACTCSPPASTAYAGANASVVDYVLDDTCLVGSGRAGTGSYGCLSGFPAEFSANGSLTRYLKVGFTAPQPPCVQSGGEPVGSVETQSPVTICCTSL